jgi:anti-anti-sigma factor
MTPNWEWQESTGDGSVLMVRGDLDVAVGAEFVAAVDEVLSTDPSINHVVIDLSAVEFIDSSGLRALLQLQQNFGGRVQIGAVSAAVQRLLELTGTLDHFRLGEQHD